MNKNHKIRFAVIGCGHIGKRHAEMISKNPDAELIALCDVRPAEECGVSDYKIPFYTDFEELLTAEKELDVVNICTPNGLHAEMAIKTMEAGFDVVVEKPLTIKKPDAEKILKTSFNTNKNVFTVMQNRYSPPSAWLKQIMDENLLGKIYLVQVNCFWNRDERYYTSGTWHGKADLDGGTLFTQFSHFIDIIYWLFGDVENIRATFADFNHKELTDFEDSGLVHFDFVNGGKCSFNYSTAVYNQNLESSLTIIGEKGTVKVAGQYMNEVVTCDIENYTMPELPPANPPNDYGLYKGSAQNHHFVIQNVIDKIHSNHPITTNALEGMKVVDIIERIYSLKKD
ncbi:MAG: Gfo/Idh/MocA family protein [Tangfeifania sp.]